MFGAVSAALHYNLFSRLLCAIFFDQLFGVPAICYFDDFGALVPAGLEPAAIRTFARCCASLGSPPGWGIRCRLPRGLFGDGGPHTHTLSSQKLESTGPPPPPPPPPPPSGKSDACDSPIRAFFQNGAISSAKMEGIVVKLCFSRSKLIGYPHRVHLRPLYKNCTPSNITPRFSHMNIGPFLAAFDPGIAPSATHSCAELSAGHYHLPRCGNFRQSNCRVAHANGVRDPRYFAAACQHPLAFGFRNSIGITPFRF